MIEVVATILHFAILLAVLKRLHALDIYEPAFVLYFFAALAYGFILIGDIDRAWDFIDLGEMSIRGGLRSVWVNGLLAVGFVYVAVRGDKRDAAATLLKKKEMESAAREFKKQCRGI